MVNQLTASNTKFMYDIEYNYCGLLSTSGVVVSHEGQNTLLIKLLIWPLPYSRYLHVDSHFFLLFIYIGDWHEILFPCTRGSEQKSALIILKLVMKF